MIKKVIKISIVVVVLTAIVLLSIHLFSLKNVESYMEIPMSSLDKDYLTTIDKQLKYLGHPDMVLTNDQKLMTFYPSGHGKGAIIAKQSENFGDSWADYTNTPESWTTSQETPCVYNINKTDGTNILVLTSGCPYWSDENIMPNGFNSTVSYDNGTTWSEFTNWYGEDWAKEMNDLHNTDIYKPYDAIVAMSSLTQLKDSQGNYIDKWMGTFHRGASEYGMDGGEAFVNYVTYLTFDENNNAVWSTPQRLLDEHREIEEKYGMCEIEIIRNDKVLILIARANNRISNSMICFSYNEGETWTQPKELPNCLTGDRHKAEYDPVSGKLIISFRQVLQDEDKYKNSLLSSQKWLSSGWVAWIGTYDDLMSFADDDASNDTYGDKLLVVGKDYDGTDCGYSGVVILDDGTVIMNSYGHFSALTLYPYIMQAKFKIADVL